MGFLDGVPERLRAERTQALGVHEAAHAVAALVGGIEFGEARIYHQNKGRVEGGELGTDNAPPKQAGSVLDSKPRAWAVFMYAGLEGELLWLTRNDLDELRDIARDWAEGDLLNLRYYGPRHGINLSWAHAEARRVVQENYRAIVSLGEVLGRRHRLNYSAASSAAGSTSHRSYD